MVTLTEPIFDLGKFLASKANKKIVSKNTDDGVIEYTVHDVVFEVPYNLNNVTYQITANPEINKVTFYNCDIKTPDQQVYLHFNNIDTIVFKYCSFPDGKFSLNFVKCSNIIFEDTSSPIHILSAPKYSRIRINTCTGSINIRNAGDIYLCGHIDGYQIYISSAVAIKCTDIIFTCMGIFTAYYIDNILLENCDAPDCTINIINANLTNVSLRCSKLFGIRLYNTIIRTMNIYGTKLNLFIARYSICHALLCDDAFKNVPTSRTTSYGFNGTEFKLYKKVNLCRLGTIIGNAIIELAVPNDAIAHMSSDGKWRVSKAIPTRLVDEQGNTKHKPLFTSLRACYDPEFKYRLGKPATPTKPFDPSDSGCSSGIHGFLTIEAASNYLN